MKKAIVAVMLIVTLSFSQYSAVAEVETTKEVEVTEIVTVKDMQVTNSEGKLLSEVKGKIPPTMIYADNTHKGILKKTSETLVAESSANVPGGVEYYRDYTVVYSGTVQLRKEVFFPDVAVSHWAYGNIYLLAENGVINGFPNGSFGADKTLTIEQFVKMVTLQLGETARERVGSESWSAPYFDKLVELGILKAAGSFYGKEVTDTITRLEMTYIISQVERYLTDNNTQFDGTMNQILSAISDEGNLEDWQKGHLVTAYGIGVLTGYPDGTFKPNANLTRAEACAVVGRLTMHDQRKPFNPSTFAQVPDLTTYATSDTQSVQRQDEDTIHVYQNRHELIDGEWVRLYPGNNFEDPEIIHAPIVGGKKQVELFEFAQKYSNWIQINHNYDGISEAHLDGSVSAQQKENHSNGLVYNLALVDAPDGIDYYDYGLGTSYFTSYTGHERVLYDISAFIGYMKININNELTTDHTIYYKTYTETRLVAPYMFNVNYKSSYNATPRIQESFEYAFELLFEDDYETFMNSWEDHMAGINTSNVETIFVNGRYARISSDSVGVTVHISLKDFNW